MSYLDDLYPDFTRTSGILISLTQKINTGIMRELGQYCRELRFAEFLRD